MSTLTAAMPLSPGRVVSHLAVAGMLLLQGCVPNRAYQVQSPTASYRYALDSKRPYYFDAEARMAFVEFLKDGTLASASERDKALELIDFYKSRETRENPAFVFLFIHGWKNNAAEISGNVWGFRRTLDFLACLTSRPVLGIYIGWPGVGWPGQNTGFAENVSFSDRESVAFKVGGGALEDLLKEIVRRTKGEQYGADTTLIMMGHSFGGLVMERAITPLLQAQIENAAPDVRVSSPVDLMLLINEAAPAQLAMPFLKYLKDNHVTYRNEAEQDFPLLVSMTSSGDVATKFAFPGGQWISPNRPSFKKTSLDEFGIDNPKTYYLLTTANTVALQNRKFVQRDPTELESTPKGAFVTMKLNDKVIFDFVPLSPAPKNDTPYWVAQLPQMFVPDHGGVFGYQFMRLLHEFVRDAHYTGSSAALPVCAVGGGALPPPPEARFVAPLAQVRALRKVMLKKQR